LCRYYADIEARCQVYHVCFGGKQFSELCPNGTIYDQVHFTCSLWKRVDCTPEGLGLSERYVEDFAAEQEFVTLDLDVQNPAQDLPWRNRNIP